MTSRAPFLLMKQVVGAVKPQDIRAELGGQKSCVASSAAGMQFGRPWKAVAGTCRGAGCGVTTTCRCNASARKAVLWCLMLPSGGDGGVLVPLVRPHLKYCVQLLAARIQEGTT